MKTNDSFQALSSEIILKAVESCGLRCTGRVIALNSMENRVFAVELEAEQGQRPPQAIIKFYRPERWKEDELFSEHLMAQILQHEDIATPRYYKIIDPAYWNPSAKQHKETQTRLQLDGGHTLGLTSGFHFCVWHKIHGRAPLELCLDDLITIGRLIARMHNLFERSLSADIFIRPHLTTHYLGETPLADLQATQCIPRPLDGALLPLIADLNRRLRWIDDCIERVPIHGDLHRLNLIQTGDGSEFWVVDFDDCVWGPEIHDLWLLASGCNLVDAQTEDVFAESLKFLTRGYSEFRKLPEGSDMLIEPLRTLRMIYYVGWIAKRWTDPLFQDVFSFFKDFSFWERTLHDLEIQREKLQQHDLLDT